jgi:hypothetical protein
MGFLTDSLDLDFNLWGPRLQHFGGCLRARLWVCHISRQVPSDRGDVVCQSDNKSNRVMITFNTQDTISD